MKTNDVLGAPEIEVAAALKKMKIKDLEKHARKILLKLGQGNFDEVMRALIKAIPGLSNSQSQHQSHHQPQYPADAIKEIIQSHLPVESPATLETKFPVEEMLNRLSVIFMVLISKKFHKIHAENK